MALKGNNSGRILALGDIVDFDLPGVSVVGQIISVFQADRVIAKVRCIINNIVQFHYLDINCLRPAKFPQYYVVS